MSSEGFEPPINPNFELSESPKRIMIAKLHYELSKAIIRFSSAKKTDPNRTLTILIWIV